MTLQLNVSWLGAQLGLNIRPLKSSLKKHRPFKMSAGDRNWRIVNAFLERQGKHGCEDSNCEPVSSGRGQECSDWRAVIKYVVNGRHQRW